MSTQRLHSFKPNKRIAIVHDWFDQFAGAEKVIQELLTCYPEADLYALTDFMNEETRQVCLDRPVKTSFIQRLPFARSSFRSYFFLFPLAIEQFDLRKYDIIISSSHSVAKGILTSAEQLHVCYCHSPARYTWDMYHLYTQQLTQNPFKRLLSRFVLHYMRLWDFQAAQRVDHFIANSRFVQKRIQKNYRRKSQVIHPPVACHTYNVEPDIKDYYVTVSRLVGYKKIDLIVETFKQTKKPLVVIGTGAEYKKLKALARQSPNIKVLGRLSDEETIEYVSHARAFVFASEEDFGIAPVEAQSAGVPVIAYGKGGAVESILDGETGILFPEQTVDSLRQAVDQFEKTESTFDRYFIKQHAEKYNASRFRYEITELIAEKIRDFEEPAPILSREHVAK